MNISDTINQHYLLNEQYKDACNFNTRLLMIQSLGSPPIDWYPWIFTQIDKTPHSRVLELGCGPGYLWQKNLEQIPPDWDITLSDFSPGMLKEAHNNLGHCGRHFAFQLIDAQEIPFENARFDIVIANLMLYHVPNRPRALSEIRRVLQADGRFYAATVSEQAFASVDTLMSVAGFQPWADATAFSLENGAEQLAGWFNEVELHRLSNTLVVKKAEPLITFMRSGIPRDQQNEAKFQHLGELIRQKLAEQGEIRITLDMGLFEASNRVE